MDAVFLPGMIFLAEMCVVTLGTLRIIFVSRGQKFLAPCLGFFEIIIWLFAISQVMQHLQNVWCHCGNARTRKVRRLLALFLFRLRAPRVRRAKILFAPVCTRVLFPWRNR